MKAARNKKIWIALTAIAYLTLILPVFGEWTQIPAFMTATLVLSGAVTLWIMFSSLRKNFGLFVIANPLLLGIFFEIVSKYYPGPPF